MSVYKGFSTYNRNRKFKLVDFDLVKQDLFNNFNIRKGEKLMNPDFGTIIWSLLFEPFTDAVKNQIIEDIKRISAYDPRVSIDRVTVTQYQYGIQIQLELRYLLSNQVSAMILQFDRNTNSLFQL